MRCQHKRDVGMVWVRVKSMSKSHAKHCASRLRWCAAIREFSVNTAARAAMRLELRACENAPKSPFKELPAALSN